MAEAPAYGWPRCLSRELAAEYLGVGVTTFDAEVKAGTWPKGETRGLKGGRLTWDRLLLDAFQDRRSGLESFAGASSPVAATTEPDNDPGTDAWMDRINATTPQQRPQHRPQAPRRRVG